MCAGGGGGSDGPAGKGGGSGCRPPSRIAGCTSPGLQTGPWLLSGCLGQAGPLGEGNGTPPGREQSSRPGPGEGRGRRIRPWHLGPGGGTQIGRGTGHRHGVRADRGWVERTGWGAGWDGGGGAWGLDCRRRSMVQREAGIGEGPGTGPRRGSSRGRRWADGLSAGQALGAERAGLVGEGRALGGRAGPRSGSEVGDGEGERPGAGTDVGEGAWIPGRNRAARVAARETGWQLRARGRRGDGRGDGRPAEAGAEARYGDESSTRPGGTRGGRGPAGGGEDASLQTPA